MGKIYELEHKMEEFEKYIPMLEALQKEYEEFKKSNVLIKNEPPQLIEKTEEDLIDKVISKVKGDKKGK